MSLKVNFTISQVLHLTVSCSHCGTSYCHAGSLQFSSEHSDARLSTWNYVRHLCNTNQLDALLILSLFRQSTSTCFRHICGPSSGGILYIYNNWYVLCFPVDCWAGWPAQSTEKHNTYQLLHIYSIPPDDGPQICPKHVKVGDSSGTVVKVLWYKSEGHWFDPSWCQWIFHRHKILPIAPWS